MFNLAAVTIQEFESVDGFVVTDLDDADHALGVVRLAPKILVDGTLLLARSITYQFGVFEQKVSGASAAVNAGPADSEAALDAFVAELAPQVASGAVSFDAGKGVEHRALDRLFAVDTRDPLSHQAEDMLFAVGVAAAASSVSGGLEDRTVAIEGFDLAGSRAGVLARQLALGGARIVVVGTAAGTTTAHAGSFDPEVLAATFEQHGAGMVAELGEVVGGPSEVVGADVDVLLVGSKVGVISHENAGSVRAGSVVPIGRVPVTAKALAMLRRAGITVVPDFVSLAGPGFAAWPTGEPTTEDVMRAITDSIRAVLAEAVTHADGPFLACCYMAETFLSTWQRTLPFGRPLA